MATRILSILLIAGLWSAAAADEQPLRVAGTYSPPPPKAGHSYPDCYCRDSSGERVELGQVACLTIGSRRVTARCEKASNLVIWRQQSEGCAPGV